MSMAVSNTKAKQAWTETIREIWETPAGENRYRFFNFAGDTLTTDRLLKLLRSSASSWNNFKKSQKHSIVWQGRGAKLFWLPGYTIDLRGLDLSRADLSERDLSNIDFSGSDLNRVDFSGSRLDTTDITGTFTDHSKLADCNARRTKWRGSKLYHVVAPRSDFSFAEFNGTHIQRCDFRGSKFYKAMICAEFDEVEVSGANFENSYVVASSFFNTDLSAAAHLNLASFHSRCRIHYQTIQRSSNVPSRLLEACGVAHFHIPHIDAISRNAAKLPSCFISYSAMDDKFIERFRNELANKGVRSWFAPRDLPFGAPTRDVIETQIDSNDRLIVVLSRHSLQSQWVEFEVETALEIERKNGTNIIIPVCIDDAVFKTKVSWARHIVRTRNIARYENWRSADSSFIDEFVRRIAKRTRRRRTSSGEPVADNASVLKR
jgi:uncharacterized protein YjbI with pentapeptide repeats